MRGIEVHAPGAYRLRDDLPVPEPGPGQARIRVKAAGICGTDVHICRGDPSLLPMLRIPFVLGHEFCGEVDSLGPGTPGPAPGTYVSAEMHEWCDHCAACRAGRFHACQNTKIHGLNLDGCFAEYVVVPARNLVILPPELPVKGGAILDPLGNAVHTALCVPVEGKAVAVVGYGPIGAMTAEVLVFEGAARIYILDVSPKALARAQRWVEAKHLHDRVTILDTSGGNHDRSLERLIAETEGGADVVLEISGHPAGINDALRIVRAAGDVVQLGLPAAEVLIEDFGKNVVFKGITIHAVIGREVFRTWERMLDLFARGFDVAGLVTGEYPLEEFPTALARFAAGEEQKAVLYPGGLPG